MVNNGIERADNRYRVDEVANGKNALIMCKKCRKWYIPTKGDISTKNPNVYWKMCQVCRLYQSRKNREFRANNAGKWGYCCGSWRAGRRKRWGRACCSAGRVWGFLAFYIVCWDYFFLVIYVIFLYTINYSLLLL